MMVKRSVCLIGVLLLLMLSFASPASASDTFMMDVPTAAGAVRQAALPDYTAKHGSAIVLAHVVSGDLDTTKTSMAVYRLDAVDQDGKLVFSDVFGMSIPFDPAGAVILDGIVPEGSTATVRCEYAGPACYLTGDASKTVVIGEGTNLIAFDLATGAAEGDTREGLTGSGLVNPFRRIVGLELPATGGSGSGRLLLAGVGLAFAGAACLLYRKEDGRDA